MKLVKSLGDIPSTEKLALIIGNFDGVHLGHQSILSKIKAMSSVNNEKIVVMTFIPHPKKILFPEKKHFLINTYKERRTFLKDCGVDYLVEIDFTRDFSTQKPTDFIDSFIIPFTNVAKFYVGYDFSFGSNKTGDSKLLASYSSTFEIVNLNEFTNANEKVSSTALRKLIIDGKLDKVNELLGRDFFLQGRVIKGKGRGKTIGFPTANMLYSKDVIIPSGGVYITKTHIKDLLYYSLTNIGSNPTFEDTDHINIETHILDFDQDIYGEMIQVEFLQKVRNEIKFSSANELISQIEDDRAFAMAYFKNA